jgi:hypothetical protein
MFPCVQPRRFLAVLVCVGIGLSIAGSAVAQDAVTISGTSTTRINGVPVSTGQL